MADRTVADLLRPEAIRLGATAADRDEAIRACGAALVAAGAAAPGYVEAMLARERSVSTYIGEGVAIPHGTLAGKDLVLRDGLSFVRFAAEVDWGGEPVTLAIGIAARDNGHVEILAQLAEILLDADRAAALRAATDPADVLAQLAPTGELVPTDEGEDSE